MSITASFTSNVARDNRAAGTGEHFPASTYTATRSVEQSIGQAAEAALASIRATLALQELARKTPEAGEYDSSPDYSGQAARKTSPTSLAWRHGDPLPASPVKVTHRWEGTVLRIDEEFFEAKLTSLTEESTDVTAEFSIENLSADDLSLLRPGASFYVTAILERRSGGRVRTSSEVRFRRLGRWHRDEIALMKERARKRRAALGFEDETGRPSFTQDD